jgi:hypothetical protein
VKAADGVGTLLALNEADHAGMPPNKSIFRSSSLLAKHSGDTLPALIGWIQQGCQVVLCGCGDVVRNTVARREDDVVCMHGCGGGP